MQQYKSSFGFSLLEIIIAITIIALFITLPVLAYSNYSKSSRDQKRKNDVLKISQALEQYKAEKGVYPVNLEQLVSDGYLTELPTDPKNEQDADGDSGSLEYGYAYESDGTTYSLTSRLEDAADDSGGTSGPGIFEVNPVNPGGMEAPDPALTARAASDPSPTIPTSTPYQSPTRLPSISYTPSPTNTPTNTPTPSNTPTATPMLPDLRVESVVRASTAPHDYTVTYCNRGNGTSAGTMTLYFQRITSPNPVGANWHRTDNLTVPAINTCATATVPLCFSTELTGGYGASHCSDSITVKATIDYFAGITELNETNNELTQVFSGFTPTPTPRNCWGINGVCDSGCNVANTSSTSHVYSSCSLNSCWSWGGQKCDTNNSATTYKDYYDNNATCTANYFGKYWSNGNTCSSNGTGNCYQFNGTWGIYNFTQSGSFYKRTYPGGSCSFEASTLPGGGTFVMNGTAMNCTWGSGGSCGTTLTNRFGVQSGSTGNIWGSGACSSNGSGQCIKLSGFLGTGYDTFNNSSNCTARNYYSSSQACTWYAN